MTINENGDLLQVLGARVDIPYARKTMPCQGDCLINPQGYAPSAVLERLVLWEGSTRPSIAVFAWTSEGTRR